MKNIAILFPGQGVQYSGMGRSLFENYSIAKQVFEEASDISSINMCRLCFEGSREELAKTENTQPAVLTFSVAAFRVFQNETEIEPSYLAGHSLGEISALVCADSIEFADALKLVKIRGKYMQEAVSAGDGAMIAVSGIGSDIVQEECIRNSDKDNIAVISNYNSPFQTVVSGHKKAIQEVGISLEKRNARVVQLNVSTPFHSPLIKSAAEKLKLHMRNQSFRMPRYPVLSNVTAFPYVSGECIDDMLASQMIQPVRWVKSMKFLQLKGIDTVIDIGPNDTVKNLMNKNMDGMSVFSFDKDEGIINRLKEGNNTAIINQSSKVFDFIERCIAIAICTPNNGSDSEYQEVFLDSYRKTRELLAKLKRNELEHDIKHMKQSLDMLQTTLRVKKCPAAERRCRLDNLFKETDTSELFHTATIE